MIKYFYIGVFILLAMMTLTGCHRTENKNLSYECISQKDAQTLMETEENYIILDVRTKEEYEEGHIPGAICIPNETIGTLAPEELSDKNQLILVYCRSGNRSKQASKKLVDMGYTNIKEFGGITSWEGEIVAE